MTAHPYLYVAQEQVALSSVPVLVNDRIEPRQAVLRTYLSASNGSYVAMPGGLTQVPANSDALVFSLQRGGGSKDTWVQTSEPVSNFSLLRSDNQPIELSRAGSDLPSRVADNLFWLGRYVERAESAVRLLRGIVVRLSEKSAQGDVRELPALLRALHDQFHMSSDGSKTNGNGHHNEAPLPSRTSLGYILDLSREPGGLYNTLHKLHGVARILRDRISTDTWRVIRSLDEEVAWPEKASDVHLSDMLAKLNYMVITLASFGGLASESMTRGQVWRFLDMGRRLERASKAAGLMRSTLVHVTRDDTPLLEALLEVSDSFMTYRRRYLASLQLGPMLDLLIADETNPRSLAFQVVALNDHVDSLPRDTMLPHLSPEQRLTTANLSMMRLIDIDAVCKAGPDGKRTELDATLKRLIADMATLSDIISRCEYLSHAQTTRASSQPCHRRCRSVCRPGGTRMKYRVSHSTTYLYSEMVLLCHNQVHHDARAMSPTRRRSAMQLEVTPEPAILADHTDYFGNNVTFFTVQERHQELEVVATSDVEVLSFNPAVPGLTPAWEDVRESLSGENIHKHFDAIQFVCDSAYVKRSPELAEYALQSFTPHRPIHEAALDLTGRIYKDFQYDKNVTNLQTSVREVFEMKRGVCQDFAHLQLSCLRSLGLSARYVSGYLMTTPPAGQKRLVGADASHAWISFYCPGFGWIDMDPTNNLVPGDKHVLLGWGRDYADVSPIQGIILGGGRHTIRVSVDVQPR